MEVVPHEHVIDRRGRRSTFQIWVVVDHPGDGVVAPVLGGNKWIIQLHLEFYLRL